MLVVYELSVSIDIKSSLLLKKRKVLIKYQCWKIQLLRCSCLHSMSFLLQIFWLDTLRGIQMLKHRCLVFSGATQNMRQQIGLVNMLQDLWNSIYSLMKNRGKKKTTKASKTMLLSMLSSTLHMSQVLISCIQYK